MITVITVYWQVVFYFPLAWINWVPLILSIFFFAGIDSLINRKWPSSELFPSLVKESILLGEFLDPIFQCACVYIYVCEFFHHVNNFMGENRLDCVFTKQNNYGGIVPHKWAIFSWSQEPLPNKWSVSFWSGWGGKTGWSARRYYNQVVAQPFFLKLRRHYVCGLF